MTQAPEHTSSDVDLAEVLARIDAAREDFRVPAIEVVAVRGGDVVVADALGTADLASGRPADGGTLFHHGSCGKAITALTAARLAAQGVLDLDEPILTWLPELTLPDAERAGAITLRDLLGHRSGLSRHDVTWIANSDWDVDEVLRRLPHLPLAHGLREQMEYSNLGYALAGLVIDRATGGPWRDAIAHQVFEPLGMSRSTWDVRVVEADGNRALPYLELDGRVEETQIRMTSAVSPAGEVASCADDSVAWLRLQLGVLPEAPADLREAVTQTHTPATPWVGGASGIPSMEAEDYGLGWVLGTYRGHRLAFHNGGIDGFTTQTFLLPDDGIGVLTSVNLHGSVFSLAAALALLDELLGEADQDWFELFSQMRTAAMTAAEQASGALGIVDDRALLGTYRHAGYGDVSITEQAEGGLVGQLGRATFVLAQGVESPQATYRELGVTFPFTIARDAEGHPVSLSFPFDPTTGDVVFTRVLA